MPPTGHHVRMQNSFCFVSLICSCIYNVDSSPSVYGSIAVASFRPTLRNSLQVLAMPTAQANSLLVTADDLSFDYVATRLQWSPSLVHLFTMFLLVFYYDRYTLPSDSFADTNSWRSLVMGLICGGVPLATTQVSRKPLSLPPS